MSERQPDIDEDGYPTEETLDEMCAYLRGPVGDELKRRFEHVLTVFIESTIYASGGWVDGIDIRGKPTRVFSFSTGGWSGCEDFIYRLRNFDGGAGLGWMCYWARQDRSGHFYFDIS